MAYGPPRPSANLLGAKARSEEAPIVLRAFAFVIDVTLIVLARMVLSVLGGGFFGSGGVLFAILLAAAGTLLYKPLAESSTGKTIGKAVLELKVIDVQTRRPPSLGQATLRLLILYAVTPIGCAIVALLNEQKRGLHDLLSGTTVVRAWAAGGGPPPV